MALYDFSGKIVDIGETQTFGAKGFKKRKFVVMEDSDSKYPNEVEFTCTKDKCDELDGMQKGQHVKIRFSVSGRRWDGPNGVRFFVELNPYSVSADGATSSDVSVPPPAQAPDIPAATATSSEPDPMDLPF